MKIHLNEGFHRDTAKPAGPVLEALEDARIVAVRKTTEGTFIFEECCDGFFAGEISLADFKALIAELQALAE